MQFPKPRNSYGSVTREVQGRGEHGLSELMWGDLGKQTRGSDLGIAQRLGGEGKPFHTAESTDE